MALNGDATFLKVVLVLGGIVGLVYGLGFFFVPDTLVAMGGGRPVDFGWLRWPGGWLIALAIGNALVIRNPAKQGPYVTMLATGTLLAGLALLYSWMNQEYSGARWFIVTPTIITLVNSALLWWARAQAREIL